MVYVLKSLKKEEIHHICTEFSFFLNKLSFGIWSKSLHYVLRELIHNAIKANIKRIFMQENLSFQEDEISGKFRKALQDQPDLLLEKLSQSSLTVKVEFVDMKNGIMVRIQNDADMLAKEKSFVDEILNASNTDEDLEYFMHHKQREGAGLGLCSAMKVLKQNNLDRTSLSYSTGNGRTVFELRIKNAL